MDKRPLSSKKFIAMAMTFVMVLLVYIPTLIIMLIKPEVAASTVNLATLAFATIGSAISLYTIGQSAVDYKINQNSSNVVEDRTITQKKFEMQYMNEGPA